MTINLSVCMDAVYYGRPFIQSLEELAEVGVKAFEFWSWWDKDIDAIVAAKERLGLTAVTFCTRFVSLVDESQREAYLYGLQETIHVAKRLGCKTILTQTGDDLGINRERQKESLVAGLKTAASLLEPENMQLVVEPLNTLVDHPGYFLSRSDEAFEMIDEVGSPHVKLLFDIYHQQISEGNVIRNITNNVDKIGHFHAAGNPGRRELDTGELNYSEIFRAIDDAGYEGYVGLEYFPLEEPLEGIKQFVLERFSRKDDHD